ncbi:Catabolite control protein A [Paenibacillus sp. CECT 9249]|nr:Catabolite control protein A [Paenibacillus sp. CECT 9249]
MVLKKLTVKDIAKQSGVSTATVSRVLNNTGYVSEQARENVLETIQKLNYQPNLIARSLKQKKTRTVGIILPDMTNPYFMSIARQIQRKLMSEGYHLLLMDSEEDAGKESESLDFLMEKRVEALIIAGTGKNREKLKMVDSLGIHVILIDRRLEGLKFDVIAEDNRSVSAEAVALLLERGHRRIGVINGPKSVVTAKERFAGVNDAFAASGLTLDERYVYSGDYTKQSGVAAIRHLMKLSPEPTAVFSANNEMTYGLYLGLHEMGIPTDHVEVVSFGDLEFSALFRHKLSVIRQNPYEIGDAAGEQVLKRLKLKRTDYENRMFYPQLIRK